MDARFVAALEQAFELGLESRTSAAGEINAVRKCEANALVVVPEIGRRLCRDAILRHIPADAPAEHQGKLDRVRLQLRRAIRKQLP